MNQVGLEWVSNIEPRGLRAYLAANGWSRIEAFGDKGDVYAREEVESEILAPASSEFGDYGTRVLQIADILGTVEERAVPAVLRDLSLASVDLIRVGAEDGDQRSVPLDAGVTLISMAREMVLAAACAAIRPQRAYRAGRYLKATDYLETVRLGHTERGSYVITLLSPVAPSLEDGQQGNLSPEFAEEPYSRQVTRRLVQGLAATREAVDLANRDLGIAAFEDRVDVGVSANLCGAIAKLLNDRERVRLGVSWALTRRSPPQRKAVAFRASEGPVLAEASRVLRERQDRPDETISGYVRALKREEGDHQGRATVKAVVDGALASVQVEFPPDDYTRIVDAHDKRLDITLDGDLRRIGQRWHLDNPRNLYVSNDGED